MRPFQQHRLPAGQSQPSPPRGSVIRLSSRLEARTHFRRSADLEGELDLVEVLPDDLLLVVEDK